MITNFYGDALTVEADVLAHQTNCKGVMGAGIAKQIKDKILTEGQFQRYEELCKEQGAYLLGDIQIFNNMNKTYSFDYITNVFGENIPTGKGLDTNYNALRIGLLKLYNEALAQGWSIVIPGLMGCGLAGGDWNYVLNDIIKPIFENSSVKLTIAYFRKEDYDKYAE